MGVQMEMEWARVDRDGVQVRVRIHSSPAFSLSLRFGAAAHTVEAVTYCPPALVPPSCGFALALVLVPPPPSSSSPPAFPLPPLRGTGRAGFELQRHPYVLAHSQRWRSAGAGTGVARAHPPLPIALPPRTHLSSLNAYAYTRVIGAGGRCGLGCLHVHMERTTLLYSHSHGSSCDQGKVSVHMRTSVAAPSYVDAEGALRRSGYHFVFGCALARRGGGDGELARVCCECAVIVPSPSLALALLGLSVSFSSNSDRSLCSAPSHACPAHPHTHGHRAQRDK
ncbi:hypothetical protein B0H13DRAFT_2400839 [Mycena leptocephala]|nr:hypothetical protein B0H13DRAFT_2400839 [Mycena leptocephala]